MIVDPSTAETEDFQMAGRWVPEYYEKNGIRLTVTQPEDPAMFLLKNPNIFSVKQNGVLDKDDCYICLDPEFAQMGLPLCYPCPRCEADETLTHSGHVPADDTICTECGFDAYAAYMESLENE